VSGGPNLPEFTVKREVPNNHTKNQGFQGVFRVKESSGLTGSGLDREYCIVVEGI
jgi:hypothetical protein